MKKTILPVSLLSLAITFVACTNQKTEKENMEKTTEISQTEESNIVDRFADIQVLRYDINGFDKLSLNQKLLVYYLAEAGYYGRDINYDQNFKYNLDIRKAFESIVENYKGDESDKNYQKFLVFAKQFWFANGLHHHYGMDKFKPDFSQDYFMELMKSTGAKLVPEAIEAIFNPSIYVKRKVKDSKKDMIAESANNFYGDGVTQKMVEDYYSKIIDKNDPEPIEYGLNSTMILKDGKVYEDVWKSGGRYGKALDKVIENLQEATKYTENEPQKKAILKLIEYFKTGDLKIWNEYNILWAHATEGDIDYILGFIEVYGDAIGKRATYESVIEINDFEASKQMAVVASNAQWFEDNSPIQKEHKKAKVTGVSYKVVQTAAESGDCSPSTPIGVNLPNNEWIREVHGSKSVSLGNIIAAYEKASGPGMLKEFAYDQAEIDRGTKYASLGGKLHTALHEVIGHASGQINKGVGQPSETLKNFASTLEEARADLVGLYYLMDQKLVDIGLMPSLEVGKAEYDGYIRNGLLTQLQRLDVGKNLEEEHMQNRQLVAAWVFEKGQKDKVIDRIVRDGKIYYHINDYNKLRTLFGELLREIQRIKSEGDYAAGKALVENYGTIVDKNVHAEVLKRVKPLNIAPYSGFVNPVLELVKDKDGKVIDVKVTNTQSFVEQMLYYGKKYGTLK
jgi:dipeptidyl-peptidase III